MRIALVTETFPPEINGVAMTLERLALAMGEAGHSVEVIRPRQRGTPGNGRHPYRELEVGAVALPGYEELNLGLPVATRLYHHWRQQQPDVVYLATEGPLGAAALAVCHARGILPVSGFHTNFQEYVRHYQLRWLELLMRTYLRFLHNSTLRTFGPSRDLLGRLRREGFHRLRLLERGVDTRLFRPDRRGADLRRKWGAPADGPVFLYVGRLAAEKNIGLLAALWPTLQVTRPDARLVLVGDGPLRPELEEQLPQAHFAGTRNGEDLAVHYASADYFLFPSLTETYGNVVAEAMASGLGVLAFRYAAAAQLIGDGRNGWTVPTGDATGFRKQAAVLAGLSPAAARPVRAAARETALSRSWEGVFRRFEGELQSAVEERRAEARQQA